VQYGVTVKGSQLYRCASLSLHLPPHGQTNMYCLSFYLSICRPLVQNRPEVKKNRGSIHTEKGTKKNTDISIRKKK
jgi:hypothetical protein